MRKVNDLHNTYKKRADHLLVSGAEVTLHGLMMRGSEWKPLAVAHSLWGDMYTGAAAMHVTVGEDPVTQPTKKQKPIGIYNECVCIYV